MIAIVGECPFHAHQFQRLGAAGLDEVAIIYNLHKSQLIITDPTHVIKTWLSEGYNVDLSEKGLSATLSSGLGV